MGSILCRSEIAVCFYCNMNELQQWCFLLLAVHFRKCSCNIWTVERKYRLCYAQFNFIKTIALYSKKTLKQIATIYNWDTQFQTDHHKQYHNLVYCW